MKALILSITLALGGLGSPAFAQEQSEEPSRRQFLRIFASAGAMTMVNPRIALSTDYSLPDFAVPEVWTEIYERNMTDGLMDYERFLNQMRGLESAVGSSMKPVVRDLILRWERFLIQAPIDMQSSEGSMVERSIKTLEKGPAARCSFLFAAS